MRKNKSAFALTAFVSALVFSAPAMAQMNWNSAYIGGSFGQSEVKDGCEGLGGISCDEKDTAWKVFGGFQFNRMFAAEIGYTDLGEIAASGGGVTASVETTAWELSALAAFPVGDRFSLFGRLGAYRAESEGRSNVGVSADESNTGLTFGFGAGFELSRNLGLRAEWQRYADVGEDDDESDIDVISIGVLWRF